MKAEVGDRIVVASVLPMAGPRRRDPADWRSWRRPISGAMVGQTARVCSFLVPMRMLSMSRSREPAIGDEQQAASGSQRTQPTKTWRVDIYLYEDRELQHRCQRRLAQRCTWRRSTCGVRLTVVRRIPTCPRLAMRSQWPARCGGWRTGCSRWPRTTSQMPRAVRYR